MLVPSDPQAQQRFLANVEALQSVCPNVVAAFESISGALEVLFQSEGAARQNIIASYLPDTLLSIGEVPESYSPSNDMNACLVIGAGDGARLQSILNETKAKVILAESRPVALYFLACNLELTEALESRRLQIAFHHQESLLASFQGFAQTFGTLRGLPNLAVAGGSPFWDKVISGDVWHPALDNGMALSYLAVFGKEDENSFRISAARMQEACLSRGPITPERPIKFLGMVASQTTALESILKRYQKAIRAIGHEMEIVVEDEVHALSSRLQAILHHQPDVLLLPVHFGHSVLEHYDTLFHLPRVSLLNNAHHHLAPLAGTFDLTQRGDHYAIAPDQEQLDFAQENFKCEGEVITLATSYEDYELPPEDEIKPVIRFIGSITDPDGKVLELRRGENWQALVERFWSFVDERFMGDMKEFERSVRDLTGFADGEIVPLHLWAALARISALESLEDLPVEIYGAANWPELLKGGPLEGAYHKHLEPDEELPAVMSRALINLNLCVLGNTSAANMRTYDASSLGTCVLQDRKPEAVAAFVEDKEMVFFDNLADLRAKAEALLADPARARAIGKAAYEKVQEQHTFTLRAQRLVELVQERYNGWQPGLFDHWVEALFPQE